MTTDPTRAAEIVERLRSSAKAFRDHPIYDQDGVGVYLTVQAQECDQAADLIEALVQRPADSARADSLIARLRSEGCRNGGQGSYAWRARELCTEAANYLASLRPDTPSPVTDEAALSGEARQAMIDGLENDINCSAELGGAVLLTIKQARQIHAALASTPQPASAETVERAVAVDLLAQELRREGGRAYERLASDVEHGRTGPHFKAALRAIEAAQAAERERCAKIALARTPVGPHAKHYVHVLVHEIAAAIRQSAKGGE